MTTCPKCGVTMYDDKCCMYCGYGLPQLTPEDRKALDSIDLTNLFGPLDEQLKRAIDFGMRQFREVRKAREAARSLYQLVVPGSVLSKTIANRWPWLKDGDDKAGYEQTCQWRYDPTHDKYDTQCGKGWMFSNDVGVKENGVVFCPFCGGEVTEKEVSDE